MLCILNIPLGVFRPCNVLGNLAKMKHHERPNEYEQRDLALARMGLQQGKLGAEDFAVQENVAGAARRIRAIKTSLQMGGFIGL